MQTSTCIPGIMATLLGLSLLLSGCVTPPAIHSVHEADHGRTLRLSSGDLVVVQLDANPSTGYSWQPQKLNSQVLAQVNGPEFTPYSSLKNSPRVGSGGWVTFKYRALGPGSSPIQLDYLRVWETNTAPVRSFQLQVDVRR